MILIKKRCKKLNYILKALEKCDGGGEYNNYRQSLFIKKVSVSVKTKEEPYE